MSLHPRPFAFLAAAPLFLLLAQDGPAPPAIAFEGVSNAASLMPAPLSGGSLAPGSLIRIRGWRLGPAQTVRAPSAPPVTELSGVSVHLRAGAGDSAAFLTKVGAEEIEAVLPSANASSAAAEIVVIRDGQPSRPSPVRLVPASFGAFSRNGHGWGPGDIRNANGQPNTFDHPARPGETVTLDGTGLGLSSPQSLTILAGARRVLHLRSASPSAPGIDRLVFDLPSDVPDGCYVPVQVLSAPGVTGNTVTLAVSREGACPMNPNWIAARAIQPGRTGLAALVHLDLLLVLSRRDHAMFPMDLGYASFESHDHALPDANPLYMFPPAGSCMNLAGFARPSELLAPLGTLDLVSGARLLDAGPELTLDGPGGQKALRKSGHPALRYSAVLGGTSPMPGSAPLPLFLRPGDYRFAIPGGAEVAPQSAIVTAVRPLLWINRSRLAVVDRSRGALVEWTSARPNGLIVILATDAEQKSGALGVCVCVERSSAGRFRIPPEMLGNVPASTPGRLGLPINLMFLAEIPAQVTPTPGGLTAFWASASGRSVEYR